MQATRKHGARYPWQQWFSRSGFTLVRGKDYHYRTSIMAQMIRNAASRPEHDVRVRISIAPDERSLTVRVL